MRLARKLFLLVVACVLLITLVPPGLQAAPAPARLVVQAVDAKAYPRLAVRLMLPSELLSHGRLGDGNFYVSENGVTRAAHSKPVGKSIQNVAAILVMDTSGSMSGRPLEDAKRAAIQFVRLIDKDAKIAVVSFGSRPRLVSGFTVHKARLIKAIDSMRASGGTAMYDALKVAAGMKTPGGASQHKSVILLSDGKDSASSTTALAARRALGDRRMPVLAVGLSSSSFSPQELSSIARASGGRWVLASDSGRLKSLYEHFAREIQSQYEVSFESARPQTKLLQIHITAKAAGVSAATMTSVKNPGGQLGSQVRLPNLTLPPLAPPASRLAPLTLTLLLVFLSVAGFAFGLVSLFLPRKNALNQLSLYDQLHERRVTDERFWGRGEEEDAIKSAMMEAVGYVAGRRGLTQLMHLKLEQAGLPLRPVEYMLIHILAVIGVGTLVALLLGNVIATLAAILFATAAPLLALELRITRRRAAFHEQLPDVLNLVSGSLRAGYGLLQAVGLVVQESLPPASIEFGRVQTEAGLGLPVEEALEKMADRMESEDFRWTVSAISVQREVGGNLAEVLDIVANTIRERDALRRHIQSLTADGRLSAIILVALPFLEAAVLYVLNPDYISMLFDGMLGIGLLIGAGVLIVIGTMWLRRIIAIEV